MSKSKNTKRALYASILSIMLCAAMLAGTTFAWFTDSVSSDKNKIVAGNLDIKLSYKNAKMAADNDEFFEVKEDTANLFVNSEGGEMLWEPGAATVAYLKLENNGSLALKYRLSVNATDVVKAEDGAALSNVLETAVVPITAAEVGTYTRETAIEAAKSGDAESVLTYAKEDTITANSDPLYFAMIIYFPEDIGNEIGGVLYNRNDVKLETDLVLNLVATQTPYEKDSFDDQYDKIALVEASTPEDFINAADNGGIIRLANEITLAENVSFSKNAVLDLNGQTLTINNAEGSIKSASGTTLTVQGNGQVNGVLYADGTFAEGSTLIVNAGENFVVNSSNATNGWAVYGHKNSHIVLNGGTYQMLSKEKGTSGTIHTVGASLVMNNAVVEVGPDSVIAAYGIYSNAATTTLNNVTVHAKYSTAVNLINAYGRTVIRGGTFITDQKVDDNTPGNPYNASPTIKYQGTLDISGASITRVGTGIRYTKTHPTPTEVEGLTMENCVFTAIGGENNAYEDTDYAK